MSVYVTSAKTNYLYNIQKNEKGGYVDCSNMLDENGNKKLLHNEVSFDFTIENGQMIVHSGWHIGTEDFDFSEKDGDDCNHYVEYYHPGLMAQIMREQYGINVEEEDYENN